MDRKLSSGEPVAKAKRGLASLKDSFTVLRKEWAQIITEPFFFVNLSAGITVASVALPLNLALAIASGLPPSTGLLAGALGGALAAIFGGSRFQVTGPAAALNVMVLAMAQQFGPVGVAAAALLVGVLQLLLSVLAAGSLIHLVPEAVLIGFTTGVGVKLLDGQVPKLLGIEHSLDEILLTFHDPVWLHEVTWPAVVCGLFVLFFILACRVAPRFPAALAAVFLTTQVAIYLDWPVHRVGEIPMLNLSLDFPQLSLTDWLSLTKLAIPLGILAAVESLLSAQAIDRLSGDRHHSNLELFGQGLGNLANGLFGGMPTSGVIVRSMANVQSNAKNRLSAFLHAIILMGSTLFLGGFLSQVPVAALAGLLCIVGFRLIEFGALIDYAKYERAQALAFIAAAAGTITNHIEAGLVAGIAISWLASRKHKSAQKTDTGPKRVAEPEEHAPAASASALYSVLDRGERWLSHLKQSASMANTAFVHPNASVIGRVVLGRDVHIAAEASVRADEGTPFYIGDETNIQDGVVIHALKQKWVTVRGEQWAVYIGKRVSLAHQALVHGPSFIGDDTFIGFKAVVHNAILGNGCYLGIGCVVVGVDIPDGRYVPHGSIIDSKAKVMSLPRVSHEHREFNEDVVEVNRGLAEAYRELESRSVGGPRSMDEI